jgi:uncharacterized protein
MKVALIGATGNVGSRILEELLARGHAVLALARHTEKIRAQSGVNTVNVDINQPDELAKLLLGANAVVSAVKFKDADPRELIRVVRKSAVNRYVVVGGAGSLELSPGIREVDGPDFPPHVRPEALRGAEFLEQLRASDLDWTFISPSRVFFAGKRTGKFRLGTDKLLFDEAGKSSVSYEDYAMALVDELENPRHLRSRFTVGY